MSLNKTQTVFDATASTYDHNRMRLIPGHEGFYAAALELVPKDARTIADLGAGSGLFSAMLHSAFPDAQLHLIDFSAAMLDLARERLGDGANVTYTLADYSSETLPAGCDAIVSALSIHHLEDPQKQALFARVLAALKPGGVFVNADHIAGPTAVLEAVYQQRWLDAVTRLGATEQQIADSLYRQQEDRRSAVEPQLAWLREAGFREVDCWFKYSSFAVMAGSRPR